MRRLLIYVLLAAFVVSAAFYMLSRFGSESDGVDIAARGLSQDPSGGGSETVSSLGRCPSHIDPTLIDQGGLPSYILGRGSWLIDDSFGPWVEEPKISNEEPGETTVRIATADASTLAGTPRAEVRTSKLVASRAEAANQDGTSIVMRTHKETDKLALVASVNSVGEIEFIGACVERYTQQFSEFFQHEYAAEELTQEDLLRALARDPNGADASALRAFSGGEPATEWVDLPASARQIDPERTPEEILDGLTVRELGVVFPDSWRQLPLVICQRIDIGWGTCIASDAGPPGDVIPLDVYLDESARLSLYVFKKPDVNLNEPLAQIGEVDFGGTNPRNTVTFDGEGISSIADLVDRAKAGEDLVKPF